MAKMAGELGYIRRVHRLEAYLMFTHELTPSENVPQVELPDIAKSSRPECVGHLQSIGYTHFICPVNMSDQSSI
jgi:hypothetical protein